jgi:V8-like Glu-specific endopeptidase
MSLALEAELELERQLAAELEAELVGEPIGEAAEQFFGRDDRFQFRAQARPPSTLLFPGNTICFIEVLDASGATIGTGTGTLVAPQVVLTAKHMLMRVSPPCSVSHQLGTRFAGIRVTPGADLSAATAARQRPASPASQVAGSARFRVDPNLDYGIAILPRPFTRPSQFMMLQPRGDFNTATLLTLAGYPCDKPRGTLWGHSDRVQLTNVTATHLFYRMDTCPGHSGSPVWLLGNNGIRLLLGVHTAGPHRCITAPAGTCVPSPPGPPVVGIPSTSPLFSVLNCGVRLTCGVINNIVQWCRAARVRGPVLDNVQFRRHCGTGTP